MTDATIKEGIYEFEFIIGAIDGELLTYTGTVCCRTGSPRPCVDNEKKCAYATQYNGLGRMDTDAPSNEEECD